MNLDTSSNLFFYIVTSAMGGLLLVMLFSALYYGWTAYRENKQRAARDKAFREALYSNPNYTPRGE
jgi:hypothetical protein